MRWPYRHILAALALAMPLSLLIAAGSRSAAVSPAPAGDGLSGTWQVSRSCSTLCVSPKPVLKLVHHWHGSVFMTDGAASQVLYLIGPQVLVHGPKDSSVLTIRVRGMLMSGSGVAADGSTFQTTWRCLAPEATSISAGMGTSGLGGTKPASVLMAMGVC